MSHDSKLRKKFDNLQRIAFDFDALVVILMKVKTGIVQYLLDFSQEIFAKFLITLDPVKRNQHCETAGHDGTDVKMGKVRGNVTHIIGPKDVAIQGGKDNGGGEDDCEEPG